uniref:Adp-dependent glucokinase-like protein n=1 Tax=Triatoma infestans TaxID=30076 RepID=A0A170X9J6_TRIIF
MVELNWILNRPVPCWQEGNTLLCVAAGLICTNAAQTAGGGDNISAAVFSCTVVAIKVSYI